MDNWSNASCVVARLVLKIVGDHPLSIAVHTDVVVEITVQVIGEQA